MGNEERIVPVNGTNPGAVVKGESALGHVYLAGAGPGDPGLVTVATVEALKSANVVLYDALSSPALLRHAPDGALLVHVGKRGGDHAMSQSEINGLIVKHALAEEAVVRLKGGDPFVFGRGSEEALACKEAGVPFSVIPGVTSAIAAAAYAGIPMTHRGLSREFMVVTGQEATDDDTMDWESAARVDTLVILMGAASLRNNMERLIEAGRDGTTPAACVRWGTRPDQQVILGTVANIAGRAAEAGLTAPMVTIVGAVATLAPELSWFTPGPLAGKKVVVTRARPQASSLASMLSGLGAQVIEASAIRARIPESNSELVATLRAGPEWLALTSANAVDAVFSALEAESFDARALAGIRIATIGPATTDALAEKGVTADFTPSRATSEALTAEIPVVASEHVVFPCSALSDRRFRDSMKARRVSVDQIVAYEVHPEPLAAWQLAELPGADAIVFASSSSVANLDGALSGTRLGAETKLISIGDRTSKTLHVTFGRVDAEASEPNIESLVDATLTALAAIPMEAAHAR
jgi:uroporphyrinogen III methyltransferase / synthase